MAATAVGFEAEGGTVDELVAAARDF